MRSLRSAVLRHDNQYGGDPRQSHTLSPLSVGCVVPYHETGGLGTEAVDRLAVSLADYRRIAGAETRTRLTVIDDGSRRRPFELPFQTAHDVGLEVSIENLGRTSARNTGLRLSSDCELTLFVDSDVIVQPALVAETVAAWSVAGGMCPRPSIVPSFFMTVRSGDLSSIETQLPLASFQHDWRAACRYQPSWVGCVADYKYVGQHFNLLERTDYLRSWRGMVGPFLLPNMVLGGCFAVPTTPALAVGGFEESFEQYGFTETTLVAKLIAEGIPVIPQIRSAALHVEWNPAHQSQSQRNERFRQAHRQFFTSFMAKPVEAYGDTRHLGSDR